MSKNKVIDAAFDDSPVDVSTEVNFIWSIANTLRGPYKSDKYKDVIIPMVIIRRFECALAGTKAKVVAQFKKSPAYPYKAMCKISGFQFYNTSEYTLAELLNDSEHIASNFKSYLNAFSLNVQEIIMSNSSGLDFEKQIDKMDKHNRLYGVIKKFSELDLNPKTIDNVKMGYIFEDLIRRFSENAEAGDHYTGRDIIKTMVNIGRNHDTVRVVNDQIGTPTYTFDLARLLVDMIETEKYGFYHATNSEVSPLTASNTSAVETCCKPGFISWYDLTCEIYKQAKIQATVIPVSTAEYTGAGSRGPKRPANSRLDKSKLIEAGFEPLPVWTDAVKRYLKEAGL